MAKTTTPTEVLFIQGGGSGAHDTDATLADSLQRALGEGYTLRYPWMPAAVDPDLDAWRDAIGAEMARAQGPLVLVGHSLGGASLLQCLSQHKPPAAVAGLFLLATPAFDGDNWNFDDLKLPADLGERLSGIPRIHLYHCRDDEVVPFAHLALHAKRIPQAVAHAVERGGHQFGNELGGVARDIRGEEG